MNGERNINSVLHDLLIGRISLEDRERVQQWLNSSSENRMQYERLMHDADLTKRHQQYAKIDEGEAWKRFQKKHLRTRLLSWGKVTRYAAILMLPIAGLAIWLLQGNEKEVGQQISHETRIAMIKSEHMGKQKATLVLANGQKVNLQSSVSRSLQDSQWKLSQSAEGDLQPQIKEESEKQENNKLYTYQNSEFWLTFEDGTKVHLNYNTTLRYPSHFGDESRVVYLDGEAYFQVAKDSKRAFIVVTANGIVKQYGTSFNINTHVSGITKVVLVEGSVSVIPNRGNECKVKPGELAVMNPDTPETVISRVDVEPYVAWNKGRFVFDNCPLEDLMRVVSGWYGRNVTFESEDIKSMHFTGDMDRYESIEPFIKAIQRVTGLDMEVTDKEIRIQKIEY